MKVNTLTAVHVLRYMLGAQGMEEPYGPVSRTWPIFVAFLETPSESLEDAATVQIGPTEGGDGSTIAMLWGRQLMDEAGGYGKYRRAVEMTSLWEFHAPAPIQALDFWSSDYPTLADFIQAVEADTTFQLLANAPDPGAEVLVNDLWDQEG